MPYGKPKKAKTKETSMTNKVRTFLGMKTLAEPSAKAKAARDPGYMGSKRKKKKY